jgi:tight adherence protein B
VTDAGILPQVVAVTLGPIGALVLARRARSAGVRSRLPAAPGRAGRARWPDARIARLAVRCSHRGLSPRRLAPFVAGAGVTWGLLGGIGAAGVAGAVAVAVIVGRHRRRAADATARRSAVLGLADRLAAELRAGSGLAEALARAGREPGPLVPALRRLEARRRLGRTLPGALAAWADEEPSPAGRHLARALAVIAAEGGPAAGALEAFADGLRDEAAVADELRAQTAQARLSAVVVGAAPVAYLLFGALVDPAGLQVLTGPGVGRLCLAAGLALQGVGWWWIHRILASGPA